MSVSNIQIVNFHKKVGKLYRNNRWRNNYKWIFCPRVIVQTGNIWLGIKCTICLQNGFNWLIIVTVVCSKTYIYYIYVEKTFTDSQSCKWPFGTWMGLWTDILIANMKMVDKVRNASWERPGMTLNSGASESSTPVLAGFVLLNLWFSVLCFVDRCLSILPFVLSLCCLSFFNLRILITLLVSANSS